MDETARLRQFWLRLLLAIGMLLGAMPLIQIPFIVRDMSGSSFDVFMTIFNALTVFPACIVAFWHRRIACVWLTLNAVVILVALAAFRAGLSGWPAEEFASVAGAVILAPWLDFMELRRWPKALDR